MRLSFFRTGTGHRVGKRPLATPFIPQISFTREVPFRRLIRSLSLRPYSLLASRADRTGAAQRPPCPPRLLRPGFQIAGSPRASAGYDYGAKLRIAPAGLPPASTAASLAAPCPGTSSRRQAEIHVPRPHRLPCPPCRSRMSGASRSAARSRRWVWPSTMRQLDEVHAAGYPAVYERVWHYGSTAQSSEPVVVPAGSKTPAGPGGLGTLTLLCPNRSAPPHFFGAAGHTGLPAFFVAESITRPPGAMNLRPISSGDVIPLRSFRLTCAFR